MFETPQSHVTFASVNQMINPLLRKKQRFVVAIPHTALNFYFAGRGLQRKSRKSSLNYL